MQFSQKALLALAFASATVAAPAIDPRDTTVVGTISSALTSLGSIAGTASANLASAVKQTKDSVIIDVKYKEIASAFQTAAGNIIKIIPTTTSALKTQVSNLNQAEIAVLTKAVGALKDTVTNVGASVSSSTKGLQGVTSAFAKTEVALVQAQLQALSAPVVQYAKNVQQLASAGLDTSSLKVATSALEDAVKNQVALIGLSPSSLPSIIPTSTSGLKLPAASLPVASIISKIVTPPTGLPKLPAVSSLPSLPLASLVSKLITIPTGLPKLTPKAEAEVEAEN